MYKPFFMDGSCYELGSHGPGEELTELQYLSTARYLNVCWYPSCLP
jgi:hypothetical protein